MSPPLVSVVVPTFNRLRYLREALDSVIAQTLDDWELVVADDGSDDDTRATLRAITDPRVQVIWLDHTGNPAAVRNAGIRAARGRYVAFLDSDDVWTSDKLEKQLSALRGSGRRWSYTGCSRTDQDGRLLTVQPHVPTHAGWIVRSLLTFETLIAMATVVVERTLLEELGGFDEGQRFCEEVDLYIRLALRAEVDLVPEPLCALRAHDEHYSDDQIGTHESWLRLLAKVPALVPDPDLRLLCLRTRSRKAVTLIRLYLGSGDVHGAVYTLARVLPSVMSSPSWWLHIAKRLTRHVAPKPALAAWRRRRGNHGH
jgi:glycosyltransferase involved in cell wall biosynthesis